MLTKPVPKTTRLENGQHPVKTGKKSIWKSMLVMLLLFSLVVGILAYFWIAQFQAKMAVFANFQMPPVAVTSAKAENLTWQETIEVVGTFAPVRGVMVSTEVSGKIDKIGFTSGDKVQEGDLLIHLDTSVEEAQLNSAQSRADLAKTKLDRAQTLHAQNVATQEELDNAEAELKQAAADANAIQATILNRKTIKAPFTGQAGIRLVQLGQYLSAGDPIVTLQTLDPIYINFDLPQQYLSDIGLGQKIVISVDGYPQPFSGEISAISPIVDSNTRNVQAQATVKNPQGDLRPGMFAQVSIITGKEEHFVTVPSTAISRAPYSNYVFIIKQMKDAKGADYLGVHQQLVKLGSTRGDQVAILEGLNGGEEVVTSGLFKLNPDAAVVINNTVIPGNNAAPQPVNN